MTREQFISHVEATDKTLRRFLTGLCCGDTALADDIAQESYIKAYLSSEGFGNPEKFTAWIYRIAYRTFLNHRRGERPMDEPLPDGVSGQEADASFRYQALYAALGEIPRQERTSILLYYMEGYSVKEVAEIEEVSEASVRQHLSRGRRHLRSLLESER